MQNSRGAPSRASVALTQDGAYLAADLAEGAKQGIWLGVRFPSPDPPPIGHMLKGGGLVGLRCADDTSTPEAAKACQAYVDRHQSFTEQYKARFRRFYRIDREGIQSLGADGKLSPVEGAKAAFKVTPRGMTVEALVPSNALPLVAEAPVESMFVHAIGVSDATPPTVPDEKWVRIDAPEPVNFDPQGDLRAAAFRLAACLSSSVRPAVAYRPGSSEGNLETVQYIQGSGLAVEPRYELLYRPTKALGDLEVGFLYSGQYHVAIRKNGGLLDVANFEGEPLGSIVRGKDIFAFGYYVGVDASDHPIPRWSVVIVHPDGTSRYGIHLDFGTLPPWKTVTEFHTPTFDTIGLRGTTENPQDVDGPPQSVEVSWTFDTGVGAYKSSVKVKKTPGKKPSSPK